MFSARYLKISSDSKRITIGGYESLFKQKSRSSNKLGEDKKRMIDEVAKGNNILGRGALVTLLAVKN